MENFSTSEFGRVNNIQRFSLGDGEGIRTTVFLQGCNLRCPWCHNPETLSHESPGMKRICAEEVFSIIAQDVPFYKKSNGGATLSGGEPLLQPAFCVAVARLCHGHGISVVVDTAGDVPFEVLKKILPFVDCFYFDIKASLAGYEKIGADGRRVYENFTRLSEVANVFARVPVVPGFNDGDMEGIAEFLSAAKISGAHLLPFHRLGSGKYKALGLRYAFGDSPPVADETMQRLVELFARKNVRCEIE